MADVKISGLPASTVPLAGTEVLPIVQGGTTKQVSIANVTAGRSVAALSVVTPTIQAEAGSAGGTIKNGSGVAQLQWGSGGGSNLSLEVGTNINPANAAVNISPTGTGTVAISPAGALTINPTAASTMNNVAIGGSIAAAGAFTTLSASGAFTANGGATLGDASGDALTINSAAVSIPNGLNFDSDTLVVNASSNYVGVNTTGVLYGTSKLNVLNPNTTDGADACATFRSAYVTGAGTSVNGLVFQDAVGTIRGYITWNNANTQYITSSDYRLKQNIAPMTGALAKVAQLKPCTYTWKESGAAGEGFIAHELAEVCPDAVMGKKDAVDKEGKPIYQGIDTSFLVATLAAAIQEQQTQINDLKSEIAKLNASNA